MCCKTACNEIQEISERSDKQYSLFPMDRSLDHKGDHSNSRIRMDVEKEKALKGTFHPILNEEVAVSFHGVLLPLHFCE